ncbi:MAG: type II secretion system F family protein [Bacillota bacterium]
MLHLISLLVFAAVSLGVLALHQVPRRNHLKEVLPGDEGLGPGPETGEGSGGWLDRWERLTLQAGLGWGRRVYLAVAGGGLGLGTVLILAGRGGSGLLVAAAAVAGPWLYVRRLRALRGARFARQLPAALFLAASVLRAGGTLLQAVEAIAAELPDPVGGEFRRIQAKMRLQVPAHLAMAESLDRVGVREFAAVVVAARIATEVGGDLAHIFDGIGRAVVETQNAQRALRSLTTEGRMSADLIALLPLLVMGLLQLLSPGYFTTYLESWPGRIVLAICLGLIYLGWRSVRRMVDIRIE